MSKIEAVNIEKIIIDEEQGIQPGALVGHVDDPEARGAVVDVEVKVVKVKVLWAKSPKSFPINNHTSSHSNAAKPFLLTHKMRKLSGTFSTNNRGLKKSGINKSVPN